MNRIIKECTVDDRCAYLLDRRQSMHYKLIEHCSKAECSALIERGWRRFGLMFFRPVCEQCTQCESIKIDCNAFTYNKSARRIIKRAAHFRMVIRQPTLTADHLDLFKRYHDYMEGLRGWDTQKVTAHNYYTSFVQGHGAFGQEILYFDGNKLIGVDLIDLLTEGISSVYFYHDPEYRSFGLGRYSIYYQIEHARSLGLQWVYLGYYVKECQSLAYKSQYKPYYILSGRPQEEDCPHWFLADHLAL